MILQITDYGVGVLATNPSPQLDVFRVGSAFGYVPLPTDTALHGTTEFTGQVAPLVVLNANVVKYVATMDTSIGDFSWGEVGFYYLGQLFALAVADSTSFKRKVGADAGNSVRLDAYLTVVGTNYAMVVDQADSSNQFMMAGLSTIDQLPPVNNTLPNAYIISAAGPNQTSFQAYTDRTGLWSFDAYQYAESAMVPILSADVQSVTIALADYSALMSPSFFGQVALQFATGVNFSICRYVSTAIQSGQTVTLGFQTPMAVQPIAGDKARVYRRVDGGSELQLPIATASLLGGIKIGNGLIIDAITGVCSVDPASLDAVASVNGKTGVVTLVANDIPGIATVGKTGSYNDLTDKPAPFALPIATTSILGGVKAPPNGNLVIDGTGVIDLGFVPVKTINGVGPNAQGDIVVTSGDIGLINPAAVTSAQDLNSNTTTGLFTITAGVASTLINAPVGSSGAATLEVVPLINTGVGDSIQRYTTEGGMWWRKSTAAVWSAWVQVATSAIATTTSLGVVKIGAGLSVLPDGTLSLNTAALPVATTTSLGVVQIGAGLSISGAGVLSWSASSIPAATTGTAGVVKPGTGLTVLPDGTLNVTPYTLPIASAATLGGIRVGDGLSIDGAGILTSSVKTVNGAGPDVSGNITVPSDTTKLNRVNGIATGIQLTFLDLGTRASGAGVSMVVTAANVQAATFTGGTITWAMSGWPSATYVECQMELINAGLTTHTFPAAVRWVNPDGTTTTSFATYIGLQRSGATNFQTAGTDFVCFWSRDGGATIYAKVL